MKKKKIASIVILFLLTLVNPLLGVVGSIFIMTWAKWSKWVKIPRSKIYAFPFLVVIIYIFFFRPFQVKADSMYPNFKDGEYLITNLVGLRFSNPKPGDVVVFIAPKEPDMDFMKRVIGVPGDKVMLKNGSVYINGKIQDEGKYVTSGVKTDQGAFLKDGRELVVPEDHYFILGDNRQYSSDSREWGFVPSRNIMGKVAFCYWNCH